MRWSSGARSGQRVNSISPDSRRGGRTTPASVQPLVAPRRCGSFDLDITKSTLTHHFRVLREAGVIEQRIEGTAKLNSLRREDLDRRFPGLLDAVLAPSPEPIG